MSSEVVGTGIVEIKTDDRQIDAGLARARAMVSKGLKDTEDEAKKTASGMSSVFSTIAKSALITTALGALGDMVRMAHEEQAGIQRLAGAVDAAGVSWDSYGAKIEKVIGARGRLAFSDGKLRDSLAVLVTATGSVNKGLALQNLAMDVARGRNIDLVTASELVAKAANRQFAALRKVGIQVTDNMTTEQALAALQAKYANAAERYAATGGAAAERLANSWDDARESIGAAVEGVLPAMAGAATVFSGFNALTGVTGGSMLAFIKPAKGAIPVLTGLKGAVTALGFALKGLFLNPLGLAVLAIAAVVIGLKLLYDRSEKFRAVVHKLGEALMNIFGPIMRVGGAVLAWLGDRLGDVGEALGIVGDEADENLGEAIPEGAAIAGAAIRGIADEVSELREKFKTAGAADTEDFLKMLVGTDEAGINGILDALYDTIGADAPARFRKVTDVAYAQIQKTARDSIFEEAEVEAPTTPAGFAAFLKEDRKAAEALIKIANSKREEYKPQ